MARRAPRAARAAGVVAALALAACPGDDRPGPSVVVTVAAPGRSAPAMMAEIGEPLEAAVSAVPGVAHLRTVASADRVTLTLALHRGVHVERTRAALRVALRAAEPTLPADAGPSSLTEALPPRPVELIVAPLDAAWALREVASREALDRCDAADELVVRLDPARLRAVGVLGATVVAVLEQGNRAVPGGRIGAGGLRFSFEDLDGLRALPLADGVRLGDVAAVGRAPAPGCHAVVDGVPVAVATTIARSDAPRPPPPLRMLDGPQVHGEFAPAAAAAGAPVVTAVPGTRWLAVRADDVAGRVQVDVGLASAGVSAEVTRAVTAQLERQGFVGGRWTGAGAAARPQVVSGPSSADRACDPRHAWPCDRVTVDAVALDRHRLADVGVDPGAAALALRLVRGGVVAGELAAGAERLPIRVRFADATTLTDVLVPSQASGPVRLDAVATVTPRDEPRALLRIDRQPAREQWP